MSKQHNERDGLTKQVKKNRDRWNHTRTSVLVQNEAWMEIRQWVNKNTTEKKTIKQSKDKTKNSMDQYKKAKQKNKKEWCNHSFLTLMKYYTPDIL